MGVCQISKKDVKLKETVFLSNNSEWAPGQLKEAPFWRNGMSPDEYEKERTYFLENLDEYPDGNYEPLWKQEGLQKGC